MFWFVLKLTWDEKNWYVFNEINKNVNKIDYLSIQFTINQQKIDWQQLEINTFKVNL